MIVVINYMALHFDNHQGGSGRPFTGVIIRKVGDGATLDALHDLALSELEGLEIENKAIIGDYRLVNITLEKDH